MTEQHKASEDAGREKRRLEIAPLIEEARKSGAWLHIPYQDVWRSPDELEKDNAEGRFLFDAKTIRIRPVKDYLDQLDASILRMTEYRASILKRSGGGTI